MMFHDDDVVPDIDTKSPAQIRREAKEVKKKLSDAGLTAEDLDKTMVERLRDFPREPDLLVYSVRLLAATLIRGWLRVYHRLQIVGGENLPRDGSFVLQSIGSYDGSVARSQLTVVPGTATGELAGLTGAGSSEAPHGSTGTFTLHYEV